MTPTDTNLAPINHLEHAQGAMPALQNIETWIAGTSLDPQFIHLLKLRASQMNGCAFCVEMHTSDARKGGEGDARLDQLIVWQHVTHFSDAEKAALAWVEALTTLDATTDFAQLRGELRAHYSDAEITALTIATGMINLWNRVQVSNH